MVPRPLRLNNTNFKIPQRIVELEGKTTQGSDIVIQHVLPHMMEYSGHFKKNIALFELETDNFAHNRWSEHINIMDEAWLTSSHAEQICKNSGVNIPITTVLHTTDIAKYNKKYEVLDIPNDNEFTFYTIADMNNRKNISAIIRAYHTEFDPSEPVALLIKMSKYGMTPQATLDELKNHCNQLKQGLKLYPKIDYYKPEILVPNVVDDETIYRLHSSCDCFVSTSCGEAWCAIAGIGVNTEKGIKNIEDVQLNDNVYTHTGKLQCVNTVMNRDYIGDIINIVPYGLSKTLALAFTPEHRHYIAKRTHKRLDENRILLPDFVQAKDINIGDFFVVPKLGCYNDNINHIFISDFIHNLNINSDGYIVCQHSYTKNGILKEIAQACDCSNKYVSKVLNNGFKSDTIMCKRVHEYVNNKGIKIPKLTLIPNKIELTPLFMFFIGHYIAEGNSDKSHIRLTTHSKEKLGRSLSMSAIKEAFNMNAKESIIANKINCTILGFNNSILAKLLRIICGHGARHKYINIAFKKSKNIGYLIQGLLYGDGHVDNTYSITTVSSVLANDIVEVCNRNNIFMSKRYSRKEYTIGCMVEHIDRFISLASPIKYNNQIIIKPVKRYNNIKEDNSNFYVPIKNIFVTKYNGKVYNLSIDVDNSYLTHGYATHNCIPAFDAMAFGKTPIVTNWGGYTDYINNNTGWLVNSYMQQAFGGTDAFQSIYTGHESWAVVDINHLRSCMREAYEDKNLREKKSAAGKQQAQNFSYEVIGPKLRKVLESYE